MTDAEHNAKAYRYEVRNEIWLAQTADLMARECRESDTDERPRRVSDAPTFRRLGFEHRRRAREAIQNGADGQQCTYDECPRDALHRLVTTVAGIARAEHYLCDEHAESLRNSPIDAPTIETDERVRQTRG